MLGSVVIGIGIAQTLHWASSYYLPAILAQPMAADLGVSATAVMGGLSLALVVSALLGPWAGAAIDRWGGRRVLGSASLLFAVGLALLATADGVAGLVLAWLVLGVAMGCGLYEAAFASLVHLHGDGARRAITGVTLIAGFASTVGWPLTTWAASAWGWRGACLLWAGLHLAVSLPMHAMLPAVRQGRRSDTPAPQRLQPTRWTAPLLAVVFALTWGISTALAAHLPQLLALGGVAPAAALAVASLVGPAQVAARITEATLLRTWHPLSAARLAGLGHPVGALLFLVLGPVAAPAFALLHGAGNGILTIAKGTLPLVFFGPDGYGARQGWLMLPARITQAAAPVLFAVLIEAGLAVALTASMVAGLLVAGCLWVLGQARAAHGAEPRHTGG